MFVRADTEITVKSAHWYLLDPEGNTKTDGLISDVYGYYSGQGKAVVFIDNDFNGKLSPGDKFEIHPAEPDSDLSGVSDVTDYSLRIKIYYEYEAPPPPPPDATIYITHSDDLASYFFEPAILEINIGDTVQFIWGNGTHNVAQVSDSDSNVYTSGFYSGSPQVGGNWNLPVEYTAQEGKLYYICEPHASMGMRGEIIINGQNTTQNATLTAIAGENLITTIGSTIQFNGAGIDSDGVIVKYEWDFDGDGAFEYSSNEDGRTTNIYNKIGNYEATLRITDNDGNTAIDSRIINVQKEDNDSTEEENGIMPALSVISGFIVMAVIALRRRY
jgi:plastocyanin